MSNPVLRCRKQGFRNREIADAVLTFLVFKDRDECRIYQCPRCSKWHLTSQDEAPHAKEGGR